VNADLLLRLTKIDMPADALREVLAVFAEMTNELRQKDHKASFDIEARLASERARSARYRSRRGAPISLELRHRIFARDGFACVYCGAKQDLACDHIIPVSKGGSSVAENLATACKPCNSSKRDQALDRWLQRRRK